MNTYAVRITYTFTKLNGQPSSIGAYCGWVKYLSNTIDGDFPNATSGHLASQIYLAPLFYPPGPVNIGRFDTFSPPTLKVAGGKVIQFGGNSTFGPLDLNINQSRFNFGYTVPPPVNGEGAVKLDDPVQI